MKNLFEKVEKTLKHEAMFSLSADKKGVKKKCIVALSGGPDSMALWHILSHLCQDQHIELVAAHLNHKLRGEESQEDALCVKSLIQKSNARLYIKEVETETIANEKRLGIEETARSLRYAFFQDVARETGAQFLATGHNLDDQAETVFMRMVRGAGMDGLGGIPPVNQLGKLKIIRPLIQVTRQEILAYLKREEIPFRIDQSNSDMKYRRNFVRHQLLPQIEKEWNPAVKTILSRSADQHREVFKYIDEETQRWWNRSVRVEKNKVKLKGGILKKASPFIRQEIVKRVLRKLTPKSAERFNYEHLVLTAGLLAEKPEKPKISLPDGVFAEKTGKDLVISVGSTERVC